MIRGIKIEICCGTLSDCLNAAAQPIDRIELNSALELGGLTPTFSTFLEARKLPGMKILCMVRPRTAGFCYKKEDISAMFLDAELFLKNGADGIVFGFLKENAQIDEDLTHRMIQLIHSYGKEAVFHKAFDETPDPEAALETLVKQHADRILTSGHSTYPNIDTGFLKSMNIKYGNRIELLPGGGINASNIVSILQTSGIHQFHMTGKSVCNDRGSYNAVDPMNIEKVIQAIESGISPHETQHILTGEDQAMIDNDAYENSICPMDDDE